MIVGLYLCGALASSGIWLSAFLKDETTAKTDVASWVVILIATMIWPLSVPLSIRERYAKQDDFPMLEPTLDVVPESYI